jgi:hypothetical protein
LCGDSKPHFDRSSLLRSIDVLLTLPSIVGFICQLTQTFASVQMSNASVVAEQLSTAASPLGVAYPEVILRAVPVFLLLILADAVYSQLYARNGDYRYCVSSSYITISSSLHSLLASAQVQRHDFESQSRHNVGTRQPTHNQPFNIK